LRQFVECLGSGTAPAVSGADGRAPVVMALAAARSWHERRPVALRDVDPG
jgi:predicted dehydrogenase